MKRELVRLRALLALLVLAVVGLAGGQGKKTVRFVAAEYSNASLPYWREVEQAFEAENPDIDVVIDVSYWDGLHQKLTTLIGAGNQPDLAIIGTSWLPEYVKAGVAQPINDRLTSAVVGRFLPKILDATTIAGKTYGLPIAVSVRALYYNKDLFEKAGVQAPKNWQELKDVAQKVTQRPRVYGLAMPIHPVDQGDQFDYFLWAAGGDWFDAQGNVTLNSPAAVEALQFMVDLYNAKLTNPEPWAQTRDETHRLFLGGRATMIATGNFLVSSIEKSAKPVNWGVTPIPRHKAAGTLAVTDTLVFFNRPEQDREAVWKFVDFVYREKWRNEFAKRESMLPELQSLADRMKEDPKLGFFVKLLPEAKFQPIHEHFMPISRLLVEACQKALMGAASPKDALDEAVAKINRDVLKK